MSDFFGLLSPLFSAQSELPGSVRVRRSLRAHLTLLIACLILIPALLSTVVFGLGARNALRVQTFRQLQTITDDKAHEIAVRIEEWLSAVERFSHRPLLLTSVADLSLPTGSPKRQAADAVMVSMLRDLTTSMRKPLGDAAILRLGDHEPLAWYGFTGPDHVRQGMGGIQIGDLKQYHYPTLGEAYFDPLSRRVVLPVVKVLRDPPNERGRPIALLVYCIHLDRAVYPSLREVPTLGPSGEVLLIDQQRRLLMPLKFADAPLLQVLPDPAARALAQGSGTHAMEDEDYRGQPVLAAHANVRYTNWSLVAEVDTAVALAPLRQVSLLWAAIVLLLLATGLWLANLTGRSISRPILELSSAARHFAEGNLSVRLPTDREDELGQLAADFNMMADSLAENKQDLERQVAARTAELSATNEELGRVNEEMSAFTYSVSHDLSSPLVSLQGLTGLLLRDYGDRLDEDGKRRLGRLQANAEMMSALVGDLLQLSRVGRLESAPAPVDLCKLILQVADSLHDSLEASSIELVIPEEPCVSVLVDPNRLRQVLSNLIANAIKYRGDTPNPRIEITYHLTNDQKVQVSVSDNGMGIAPQHHDRIFQPFQRLPEVKSLPGTGMGLAIARKIVQLYGGTIWVESEPGKGSTFHFTLPKAGGQA